MKRVGNLFTCLTILSLICGYLACNKMKETSVSREPSKKSNRLFRIIQNNKYGYIDKTGKVVISPQFEYAGAFSEGLAEIKIGNKCGYIDKMGKIVIPPQFDDVWPFSDGIAIVAISDKLGYIDRTGKYIWNPTK